MATSAGSLPGEAGPSSILGKGGHPGLLLMSAVFGAASVGIFHSNSVGLTGPPFVFEALALTGRHGMRSCFSGQNIALGVIAVPLLTAISFGLAAVAGRLEYGFEPDPEPDPISTAAGAGAVQPRPTGCP